MSRSRSSGILPSSRNGCAMLSNTDSDENSAPRWNIMPERLRISSAVSARCSPGPRRARWMRARRRRLSSPRICRTSVVLPEPEPPSERRRSRRAARRSSDAGGRRCARSAWSRRAPRSPARRSTAAAGRARSVGECRRHPSPTFWNRIANTASARITMVIDVTTEVVVPSPEALRIRLDTKAEMTADDARSACRTRRPCRARSTGSRSGTTLGSARAKIAHVDTQHELRGERAAGQRDDVGPHHEQRHRHAERDHARQGSAAGRAGCPSRAWRRVPRSRASRRSAR